MRGLLILSVVALVVPAILGTGSSSAAQDCGIGTTGVLSVDNALAAAPPCADIQVTSAAKQPQGSVFSFTAAGSVGGDSAPIDSYEWDWNNDNTFDQNTGTVPQASHQFDTPGIFTVRVQVTSQGLTAIDTVTIVVWPSPNNAPVASFTTNAPAQTGIPQSFDATTSHDDDPDGKITKYEWDWNNDGTYDDTATIPVIQHTFATPGSVTVGLRVTDERTAPDTATGVTTQVVAVTRPPVAELTATPNVLSPGGTVQFDASASTDPDGAGIALYEWDFDGNGTYDASGTAATIAHAYPVTGTFAAGVRVTDGDGGTGTKSVAVVVSNALPTARLSVTPNPVTAGQSVLLDGSDSTDADGTVVRYDWDLDGNGTYETTSGATPSIAWIYPNVTTVSVGLRVRDDNGATGVAHVTLKVTAPPPAGGGGAGGGTTGGGTTGGGTTGGGTTGGGTTGGGTTGGGTTGGGSTGGGGETGGGSSGGGGTAGNPIVASLGGSAVQKSKSVLKSGLALSCKADRASTCTVTATLSASDARKLKLASKKTTKPIVIGSARVTLKKAGSGALKLKLSKKAASALKKSKTVRVALTGIVTSGADRASVGRAVLVKR